MAASKKLRNFLIVFVLVTVLYTFLLFPFPFWLHAGLTIVCLTLTLLGLTIVFFRNLFRFGRDSEFRIRKRIEITHRSLLESLSNTLELRSLLISIIVIVSKNLRLSGSSIFLLDKDYNYYMLKESFKLKENATHAKLPRSHPLIHYLKVHKNVIVTAELKKGENEHFAIVSLLEQYGAAYCVPIFFNEELTAIIYFGTRVSNLPLHKLELEFLGLLSVMTGKPISNSLAHYETLKKVDELNSLYEVGKVISSTFEIKKTFNIIASNAAILLKAPKVLVRMRENMYLPFQEKKTIGFTPEQERFLQENGPTTDLLTEKLAKAKYPVLIENSRVSPFFKTTYLKTLEIRSVLAIPLFDSDLNVIGELRVMRSDSQPPFCQRDLVLASNMANNVTIALRNAQLYSELSTIYSISTTLNSTIEFSALQEKIVSVLEQEFHFKRILLFIFDKKSSKLIASYGRGWEKKIYKELDISMYKSILGRSIVEGRIIQVENAERDPRVSPDLVSFLRLKSFLNIPLLTLGTIVGAIMADYEDEPIQSQNINMKLLPSIASLSSMALANCLLHYESEQLNLSLKKEQSKTQKELQIARNIQQGLLSTNIPKVPWLTIATKNMPCRSVGGDFFNFVQHSSERLGIVIGDVSGKGVPAALIMSMANGIFSELGSLYSSPKQVLVKANNSLREYLKEIPMFYVTAFYGQFDFQNEIFTYCKAGHNPPVYYSAHDRRVRFLDTEGSYLGTFEDGGFMEKTLQLGSGDKLIFYTDGVTEARGNSREMFGKERLASLILRHANLPPQELIDTIYTHLREFTQNSEMSDDLILVVCEVTGSPRGASLSTDMQHFSYTIPSDLARTKELVRQLLAEIQPLIANSQQLFHIRLAVSEALRNAVEHGNKNDLTKNVDLLCRLSNRKIEITVTDEGKGFDPASVTVPENKDESRGRGRGLMVIYGCMDEVMYNKKGNSIILTKHFVS